MTVLARLCGAACLGDMSRPWPALAVAWDSQRCQELPDEVRMLRMHVQSRVQLQEERGACEHQADRDWD